MSMLVGQTVPYTIAFVDKDGNPTAFDGTIPPATSLSDPTLGTITQAADGLSGSFLASALGTETFSAIALSAAGNTIPITSASEDIVAGGPVSGAIKLGTPA